MLTYYLNIKITKIRIPNLCAFAILSKIRPFDTLKFKEKIKNINWMNEIDKCISYIALCLYIDFKYI